MTEWVDGDPGVVSDTGIVNSTPLPTTWRGAIGWWYRPIVVADTWISFGYLVVGAVWAAVMFVVVLVSFTVALALLPVVVGVLLVLPAFGLLDALVGVERRRASWIGEPVPPRPHAPGVDTSRRRSWFRRTTGALADPERWRQVAFVGTQLVVAPLLFAIAAAPWLALLTLFFGTAFDLASLDLFAVVVGLAVAGVAPRITTAAAALDRGVVAWFLGPDPTSELRERVDELSQQRAMILDAVGAERRRIERNLHDGVQQQLVALGIDIGRARQRLAEDPEAATALLDDALAKVRSAVGELRVIGRGLHPAVLDDRGLDAALSSIVASASIPIDVTVDVDSALPEDVAAAAYYVVNEAVANIQKHARARTASVIVDTNGGLLTVTVRDDGRGGADPADGSGLAGIRARVESLDGGFRIESPPGGPTTLAAVIPMRGAAPLPPPLVPSP